MVILLKRAYETPEQNDGFRILVDRIWPRGVSKDFAHIDFWAKDVTPSTSLRKWFSHDPLKWDEFKRRYINELDDNPKAVEEFIKYLQHDRVTFVFGAKDTLHTHAIILKEYIENKIN
ncbi:DUF488 family protein [Sulfurimonas sp. HSL-1716]|uniref:DUF488 domain-containing protein n=1 Tax=Hydrocurvibacter sulfurireducens TaxID=3131937 RepID=UPI0031F9EFE7